MLIWIRKHMPACIALLAVGVYFSMVLIDLREQQASIEWCEETICLSKEWIDVANRVMDNDHYDGMQDPAQTMNLFLKDLGSLQYQKEAVYKFLIFTLNKDTRFVDISLAAILNAQRINWNLEQQTILKNAVSNYWREQTNEGNWYENITGTSPKNNRPPKQLTQLLNRGVPVSENQEPDVLQ